MFQNQDKEENHFWMSYTDLVTGFLIIFIIIMFILYTRNSERHAVEGTYGEMKENMKDEFDKVDNVTLTEDEATIRFFSKNEDELLFEKGKYSPTKYFNSLLEDAIPIYLKELEKIYKNKGKVMIKEVRIEGHTDSDKDYFFNLELSSNRARQVQDYIMKSKAYENLDEEFKDYLQKHFIACGYSFSKPLNAKGESTSPDGENKMMSRRVEFRVLLEYQKEDNNED